MVTMAPDSLNNKHIQNHDGGLKLTVRAAGLGVMLHPSSASGCHLVELMAPDFRNNKHIQNLGGP